MRTRRPAGLGSGSRAERAAGERAGAVVVVQLSAGARLDGVGRRDSPPALGPVPLPPFLPHPRRERGAEARLGRQRTGRSKRG